MPRPVRAVRRVVVTVGGMTVLAAGLLMLVLPGPGLLASAAGLAILATEYDWARRHVTRVRQRAHQVSQIAGASPRNTALSIGFGVSLLAAGTGSVQMPHLVPVGGAAAGVGLIVGGAAVVLGTVVGYHERRHAVRRYAVPRHVPWPRARASGLSARVPKRLEQDERAGTSQQHPPEHGVGEERDDTDTREHTTHDDGSGKPHVT